MLQNDVLEKGIFKLRPKLAENCAENRRDWHQASWWEMVEQWMDGGAAGWSSPSRRYDHGERSEPEGVMPPSRCKGLESNFAFPGR